MIRATLIVFVAIVSWVTPLGTEWARGALAQQSTPAADCPDTTADENRNLVRRYSQVDWSQASDELLAEFLTDDFVHHGLTSLIDWEGWPAAFPDLSATLAPIIAEGDLVAGRWTAKGTHSGEFQGIAPTGNTVTWTGASIYRIECGHIAEIWNQQDFLALFQQMGVAIGPQPQTGAATPDTAQASPAASTPAAECPATTAEENTDIVHRWYDEVRSQGNYDAIAELLAESHLSDRTLETSVGPESREANIRLWRDAFPDMAFTVEQILAEGEIVAARWTATGTHEGEHFGVAPTREQVSWRGITFFEIECGKIATELVEADAFDLFRQLGLPTLPATPPAN